MYPFREDRLCKNELDLSDFDPDSVSSPPGAGDPVRYGVRRGVSRVITLYYYIHFFPDYTGERSNR